MDCIRVRLAFLAFCLVGLGCGTSSMAPNDGGGNPPDGGPADGGFRAVNVCGASSGSVAWTASIPAATTSLVPTDIVASPTTNDVVVGDIHDGSTFEQYRWNSSGALLSSHQDSKGGYVGSLYPSNLVIDGQNDVFYGLVLTGLVENSNTGASLTFTRLAPDGSTVFTNTQPAAEPTSSGQASVVVFQAGHDSGGGLHATLTMGSPQYFAPAVYCWGPNGQDNGPSAGAVAGSLAASDFLWPSLDGSLHLAQSVTTASDLSYLAGCPLTVPAGGATLLGDFSGGGSCIEAQLLTLPTAAIQQRAFREGADGSLSLAVVYSGTINLGEGSMTSTGTNALALARFDAAGHLQWARNFDGVGWSFKLGSLDTNAAGVGILTAGYAGGVNLGGGALSANADTFLAVFDSMGDLKWSKVVTVGSSGQLLAAVGPCGVALATNSPTVDLGTGPLSTASPPSPATIGVAALGL